MFLDSEASDISIGLSHLFLIVNEKLYITTIQDFRGFRVSFLRVATEFVLNIHFIEIRDILKGVIKHGCPNPVLRAACDPRKKILRPPELFRDELAEKFFNKPNQFFCFSVWSPPKILAKKHIKIW